MKFSVNWLREFVELPSSAEELAELLTLAGIEIEGIAKRGANFDKVIVAQITASAQHPNADRLTVCQVDDGSGQPRQIVCGAKNYKVGDKVPLALPGAVLMNDLKIKPSKLRGVESQGMLCSPSELGLSEDSDGLLILSPEAKIGEPIASLFPDDTILDVEITPNRGDLLSHFGLAREIAALVGSSRGACPEPSRRDDRGRRSAPSLPETREGLRISAPEQCPFYSARRIENIKVGPSPDWLRAKLEAVGLRSINNIVDITNFVMLEFGQPLHAFDADKLKGGINVRLAHAGEKFLALDGKTYSLSERDLIIADNARAIGIAGVMGGEDTGVTELTTTLLLESAFFDPASVRRTARTLNLPSDASYRFERRVDPGMILPSSQRAAELIQEIAGGKAAPDIATAGELPAAPPDVPLRYERCDRLIGLPVPSERVDEILGRFGLKKVGPGTDEVSWRIPSFRFDLQRDVDLIEEVVRVFGIERVPLRDRSRFTPESSADRIYDFESALRQRLIARGIFEARTSALTPRQAGLFGAGAIELRNPLSEDHVALRPTLLAGLLDVLGRNIRNGVSSVRLFELGRVFAPPDVVEKRSLALVFSGDAASRVHWRSGPRRLDLFDLKGVIESIGIRELSFRRAERSELSLSADVLSGSDVIGFFGQLAAAHAATAGAIAPVFVAEIEIRSEMMAAAGSKSFREIEKFPAIARDIAMIVPEELSHEEIFSTIASANEPLLASVELFDVFSGKEEQNFGAGKKSLAYTLTYRDKTRTLTNEEITVVHAKIRERLQRELGAELRE
ncbi:MAG TPA: phenylalanine--tRNA ligase subunit beta [Chthoniobacterales bacterium]|nr:phenylalanine--tRNA ligase subunit beta [Chthoniobacterales bacterium]